MSKPISRLWFLGPPAAILLSLLVYYAKFDSVRRWVDPRFPWVADHIGSRLPALPNESPVPSAPRHASGPSPSSRESEETPLFPASAAPPLGPSFIAPDGSVDVRKLAADRTAWPKTVKLKLAKEFPAVVNGKVVGKIEAPVGTEAKLVSIQDGQLGVEYQGGGAWLTVDETDLAQRLHR